MHCDLPIGTPFVCRDRGRWLLWQIVDGVPNPKYPEWGPFAYTGISAPLAPGETIHRCVWLADRLESRASYTLQAGDVEWVDSGLVQIFGPDKGQPIYRNRFGGRSPAWLRACD